MELVGWVYLVLVLDRYKKKIVGHDAGLQATAAHRLLALEQAVQRQFPVQEFKGSGVFVTLKERTIMAPYFM